MKKTNLRLGPPIVLPLGGVLEERTEDNTPSPFAVCTVRRECESAGRGRPSFQSLTFPSTEMIGRLSPEALGKQARGRPAEGSSHNPNSFRHATLFELGRSEMMKLWRRTLMKKRPLASRVERDAIIMGRPARTPYFIFPPDRQDKSASQMSKRKSNHVIICRQGEIWSLAWLISLSPLVTAGHAQGDEDVMRRRRSSPRKGPVWRSSAESFENSLFSVSVRSGAIPQLCKLQRLDPP